MPTAISFPAIRTRPTPRSIYRGRCTISVPAAGASSARRLLDAAAANASSVVQQTVLSVVQSYYGVVAADANLLAAKITETVSRHSFEIARSLREGGAGTMADVLQAETAWDQAVLTRVQ